VTDLSPAGAGQRPNRRAMTFGLLRSLATTVILVVLFYVLPLDQQVSDVWWRLLIGLVVFVLVIAWQLRKIADSKFPMVRAVESLALSTPLFLILFASTYYLMALNVPHSFNTLHLTRTDSLYFTITTFATVGFGDITAVSQTARVVVMLQILLDLAILGLGIRVFAMAVKRGLSRQAADDPASTDGPPAA
jgi:voltage-gated potassium channel